MTVELKRHLFTVDDYEKMVGAGVFDQEARVELLEGEVVEVSPMGSRHAATISRLERALRKGLGGRILLRIQCPLRVGEHSEPEPDLALLKPREDFYAERHPEPRDTFLLIEVADTTLHSDQQVKIPLYGRHQVPEAWIVNLVDDVLEVYRSPGSDGFGEKRVFSAGDAVSLSRFPSVVLELSAIFG